MTDYQPPARFKRLMKTSGWSVAACCLVAVACGRKPELAQVAGEVTFQGAPVAEAIVLFSSAELGVYKTANVVGGKFEVATPDGVGIKPGAYQVAISPPMVDHPIGPILEPPKPVVYADIPRRFHDAQTSGFTAQLVAGENSLTFDMQP